MPSPREDSVKKAPRKVLRSPSVVLVSFSRLNLLPCMICVLFVTFKVRL